MAGWIKVFRKLRDWQWYSDSHMVHLFIHLLLEANHEPKKWKGINIEKGQLIFGRKAASETLGISEKSIRTCMERLKSTNEVAIQSTNRFSLVTIVNWEDYQGEEKKRPAERPANGQTNGQQTATPKEYKEDTTNVVSNVHPLCLWIKRELPSVSKMRDQLNNDQAEKLIKDFDKKVIREVLESMENYIPLLKKSKSVNRTIRAWIARRDINQESTQSKPKTEKSDYSEMNEFYKERQEPNLKAV